MTDIISGFKWPHGTSVITGARRLGKSTLYQKYVNEFIFLHTASVKKAARVFGIGLTRVGLLPAPSKGKGKKAAFARRQKVARKALLAYRAVSLGQYHELTKSKET